MKITTLIGTATLISPFFAGISSSAPKEDRPNIIVILTDDQGWGDLGITGNTNLYTPNIDRLAKSGAIFSHFYVCSVSSPTRGELLTGRYNPRLGIYSTSEGGERLNLGETTIAEVFRSAGYATAAFGKWHNGMQYPYHPNARGFDEFYGFCSGHWGEYFYPPLDHNGKLVQGTGFITDDLTEKALDFIEKNKNNPFFVYIPFNTPHDPLQVPDLWWNRFREKELTKFTDERNKENIQYTRAVLAMCENNDWNVGRIMDRLKELDLEKNTIVVYFHDNGPNEWRWNDGMKGRKGSVDEGGVRSPLIMRWPDKIKPGMKIDEISSVIDILPTLADMAGIKAKTNNPVDGISLKPMLIEGKRSLNNGLFSITGMVS
jgi:arylsulfatase A-like enzyme